MLDAAIPKPHSQPFNCNCKINIYRLAENAGTSVEQLERFYLKRMEPTGERVRNIQAFGSG